MALLSRLTLLLAMIECVAVSGAAALPPGRAWSVPEQLTLPGWDFVATPQLVAGADGIPRLHAVAAKGSGATFVTDVYGFAWAESAWAPAQQLGHPLTALSPVAQPMNTNVVLSHDIRLVPDDPFEVLRYLVLGNLDSGSVDTVSTVYDVTTQRAGVVTATRRWVFVNNAGTLELHSRANSAPTWRKFILPVSPSGGPGTLTAAPLSDTTAVLAWSTESLALRWAIAYPDTYELKGVIVPMGAGPQAWMSSSGRLWLAWGSVFETAHLSEFSAGQWQPPISLTCDFQTGGQAGVVGA